MANTPHPPKRNRPLNANYNAIEPLPDGTLKPVVLRFIEAYTGTANGDPFKAGMLARLPYKRVQSMRNAVRTILMWPQVQEAIKARYRDVAAMTEEEVLARRVEQARGPSAYFRVDGRGRLKLDAKALIEDGKGHLIREVVDGPSGRQEVRFYDSAKALQDIGEHLGLWGPPRQGQVPGGNTFNQYNFGEGGRAGEPSIEEMRAAVMEFIEEQARKNAIEGAIEGEVLGEQGESEEGEAALRKQPGPWSDNLKLAD